MFLLLYQHSFQNSISVLPLECYKALARYMCQDAFPDCAENNVTLASPSYPCEDFCTTTESVSLELNHNFCWRSFIECRYARLLFLLLVKFP